MPFQLLDSTAAAAGGGGGGGGLPPACCPLACSLLPAACCLAAASASFCHEKKRTCRTGKHHGTEGRNNALQWQSRRPNVPSETLHKAAYVSALRCSRPASCLLPPRLLTAACRLLPCCCFSILLPWKNAPAGQENTMALKDGIMRCNGNLGGLTSLCCCCWCWWWWSWWWWWWAASCRLLAHCCLPPAALLLLQHPFAMKKRTCRTGKHHGTEGRNNALQWQSRRPNVPSETLHKTYVSARRCPFSS